MLPGVGGLEYIVIAVLLIIFVSPKDLPDLIIGIGKIFKKIKKLSLEFKEMISDISKETRIDELEEITNKARPIDLTDDIANSINESIKDNFEDKSEKDKKWVQIKQIWETLSNLY